jgi:hypothetical protein
VQVEVEEGGLLDPELAGPALLLLGAGALGGTAGSPAATQSHWHCGQVVPGGHVGQLQAQVPCWTHPPPEPPPTQVQSQGGQAAPGAQGAQAHVHVPPPDPAPPPEQSHSGWGHAAPAGQTSGVMQAQGLPSACFARQNPLLGQLSPTGQRTATFAQVHRESAVQEDSSRSDAQGSICWQTPAGHCAPAGQVAPIASHVHCEAVTAWQVVASV